MCKCPFSGQQMKGEHGGNRSDRLVKCRQVEGSFLMLGLKGESRNLTVREKGHLIKTKIKRSSPTALQTHT